jgi:predicted dehydrogenase
VFFPWRLQKLFRREVVYSAFANRSLENQRRIADDLGAVQNYRKRAMGQLQGLQTPGLWGDKDRVKDIDDGSPEAIIATACKVARDSYRSYDLWEGGEAFNSRHFQWARTLVRLATETEKPDGVMTMTTTHQRAWTTAIAMQMGCHVYIEKPMCLTIEEGRQLVNFARKYTRVTQVGTQQRSLPITQWACKQSQDGAIGKVTTVLAPNFVGPNIWENKPQQAYYGGMTDEIWDIWTNQAVFRPYHRDLHTRWDNWWDYDAGGRTFGVSGWGTHSYDQVNMALGTNETGPVEILLEEPSEIRSSGKFDNRTPGEDETGAAYYFMANVTGPRGKMTMWFANGVELRLNLDGDRGPGLGCIITGEKGKLEINRHKLASNPRDIVANMPEEFKNARDETIYHVENWIDCIKSSEKCTADVEYGQRSTTICELVNIVRATAPVGQKIGWDPVRERFMNNDKGNEMLARPRRKEYKLPELT